MLYLLKREPKLLLKIFWKSMKTPKKISEKRKKWKKKNRMKIRKLLKMKKEFKICLKMEKMMISVILKRILDKKMMIN